MPNIRDVATFCSESDDPHDLEFLWISLKINRVPFRYTLNIYKVSWPPMDHNLCYHLGTDPKCRNWDRNGTFFWRCDLEFLWMTFKINRGLLSNIHWIYISSFIVIHELQLELSSGNGPKMQKSGSKQHFFGRCNLEFLHGWPWKSIGLLSDTPLI